MRRLLWIALATAPFACTVGPDYERVELDVPDRFRDATEDQSLTTPAALSWFDVYTDPVLQALITEALANNTDLLIAAARVAEARAASAIAESRLFPTADGNASLRTQGIARDGFPLFPEPQDRDGGTITLGGFAVWELDLWGRFRRAAEASQAQLLASELDRAAIAQSLVVELSAAYFRLLAADADLAITRRTIQSRDESLRLVQARLDRGIASMLEVRQAEGLLQSAQLLVPQLEAARSREENLIRQLIGSTPGPVPRGETLDHQVASLTVPAGLPSELLERRPDVLAAESQLAASVAGIGEAKALLFPQVTLTGVGGVSSQQLSGLFNGSSLFWDAAVEVSIPIFNAGRLEANVAAAEARADQATGIYRRTVRTAFREVADSLITLEKLKTFRRIQEKQVAVLIDQSRLSNARYRGGVTSYLEVLDSERQLFEAQRSLVGARLDEVSAVGVLFRALGGGWTPEEADAAPMPEERAARDADPTGSAG